MTQVSGNDRNYLEIEQDLRKRYRKNLWCKFTKAIRTYELVQEGDRIAVCISGGKDSMLMAKLFQELKRHDKFDFDVKFLVMDPGYRAENRQLIEQNAMRLNIPLTIFESDIFESVLHIDNSPCYLCARMRRGYLYSKASELGCNKIALGHHFDDVIETILMGMLYGAQVQTMMPKLHSTNFAGMELIRPMYLIREEHIKAWRDYNNLHFLQCACRFTENSAFRGDLENTSKRREVKELIRTLRRINPFVENNIFKSVENVNLSTVIAYKQHGIRHHFLDDYDATASDEAQQEKPQEGIQQASPQEGIQQEKPQEGIQQASPQEGIQQEKPQEGIQQASSQEGIQQEKPQEGIQQADGMQDGVGRTECVKNINSTGRSIVQACVADEKLARLKAYLRTLGSVAVAFSGGVDSTFLLKVAHEVLGENACAVTATACVFPAGETAQAQDFCRKEGIAQYFYEADTLSIEGFCDNPPDRCYLCKRELLHGIEKTAQEHGFRYIVEGSNMDDLGDYRPGLRAVAESGVRSPLREVELYKQEIRKLSRRYSLPTWEKPSYACLASRFVYGETITKEKLSMVEKAEQLLMDKGFGQLRVRVHGTLARIEIPVADFDRIVQEDIREEITARFQEYGFCYVTFDLQGYQMGSMNKILSSMETTEDVT